MKNIFDNIALLLVVLISILIVVLIVQYNMIDEKHETISIPQNHTPSKRQKRTQYLNALKKYTKTNVNVEKNKPVEHKELDIVPLNKTINKSQENDMIGKALESILE